MKDDGELRKRRVSSRTSTRFLTRQQGHWNSLHKPSVLFNLRDRQPFTWVDVQQLEEKFCRREVKGKSQ